MSTVACPYCQHEYTPDSEGEESFEETCPSCQERFIVDVVISVSYAARCFPERHDILADAMPIYGGRFCRRCGQHVQQEQ